MSLIVIKIVLFSVAVQGQFIHEFHIKENAMIYRTILNLNSLLISKNKIDTTKSRDSKIYMSTVINSGLFSLDSDSNLKVTKHIDREELCPPQMLMQSTNLCGSIQICCHVLEFQVSYKDEDVQSYFLRVFVDDENDNRPIFPIIQTPFCVVEENKPVGSKILLPKAQDADTDSFGISSYKLQTPFIVGNYSDFELDQESKSLAPYLIIVAPLNREKTSKYTFNLIAIDGVDGNRNTGQTEITIRIRDVNDNTPKFEKHIYFATVKENSVPDPIFDVTVTDEDEDDNGRIELNIADNGQTWLSRFFILDVTDNTIGRIRAQIRSITALDYEQPPHFYEFKIIAKDRGRNPLSSTATVRIHVINVNDKGPEIRFVRNGRPVTTGFSIFEGTASNVMLAHVQVSDADTTISQLQCNLRTCESLLMIEESRFRHPANLYKQYALRTTQPIDREAIAVCLVDSRMVVVIQCFDHDAERPLSHNSSIFITINDINDNAPKFSQSKYNGYIDENVVNHEITVHPPITATDKDKGLNAKLSFSLKDEENQTETVFFRVDTESGKLYNLHTFDYEKKSLYNFLIIAQDHGSPNRLSASSQITVRVRDKNDNAPKFAQSHFTFSVNENVEIGYLIGVVLATDNDSIPKNRDIRYYVKSDAQNRAESHIILDPISGQIRTRQPIDREKITTITFVCEARNPSRVESDSLQEAMVVINVKDLNDSPPTFRLLDVTKSRMVVFLEVLELGQICEPIPFAIDDADDISKSAMCCDLRLKNDYNGLLSISTESQTIICINKVPLNVRNIQVTLIAADRNGNNSMEGEGSFTIVLKNDPSIIKKSKVKPTNTNEQKPQHRKEEIRQITLVIILASLAGICLIIIVIIIVITQKRCDRLNIDNDLTEDEKNNENNSQPMIERQCIVQKNDLEATQFLDMISTSPASYYNAMHPLYLNQSLKSIQPSMYDKSADSLFNDNYNRTLQLTNKYQHLQRSNDAYQILNNRLVNYDHQSEPNPSQSLLKFEIDKSSIEDGNGCLRGSPNVTTSINNSTTRCNQTSFV